MDRRERYNDDEETLRIALHAFQTRLWTSLPGIVDSFDPEKMTVNVQPTIDGQERDNQGNVKAFRNHRRGE